MILFTIAMEQSIGRLMVGQIRIPTVFLMTTSTCLMKFLIFGNQNADMTGGLMNELEVIVSKIEQVQRIIKQDGSDLTNEGVIYLLEVFKNFCLELKEKE